MAEAFSVPPCPKCSRGEGGQSGDGILKPDVTFFGDNVPRWRHEAANELVRLEAHQKAGVHYAPHFCSKSPPNKSNNNLLIMLMMLMMIYYYFYQY